MDDIQIEAVYGEGAHSASLYARYQGQQVGYAWLAIDGASARLIDINVYHRKGRWSWWPPFYYRGQDYRGQGIGTRLLERVIEICLAQGMDHLVGELHGDIDRLSGWYQRHGFQIGPGLAIHREILGSG